MLSRVAENVYWLARYLERAENTARLIIATSHMLLDAPEGSEGETAPSQMGWARLITISGCQIPFAERQLTADEPGVVWFLMGDEENGSSIRSSLVAARENLRATRDVFPKKAAEYLNEMYLAFTRGLDHITQDEGQRYQVLDHVIRECQTITGLLFSTMSRDSAFEFFRMGQNLERADMTSRILDVGGFGLGNTDVDRLLLPLVNAHWLAILRSLSAEQMYRRHVNPRVRGYRVVAFLLGDIQFPRAFRCCLEVVDNCLANLPRNESLRALLADKSRPLVELEPGALLKEVGALHTFVDQLQIALGELHSAISERYFPRPLG